MRRDWLIPGGVVVLLIALCMFGGRTEPTKFPDGPPKPSAGVYLTHAQYDRMQDLITDMEKKLEENGLPIPGSRLKYVEGPKRKASNQ